MGVYSEQIIESKLFRQFDLLVDHEDVGKADVAKLKQLVLDVSDAVGPHLDLICATFWQYTKHDLRHLSNVADLICRILPKLSSGIEAIHLNAVELAILWLAILLHDIGMFVGDKEKQETLESEDYRKYLLHCSDRVEAARKARESGLELKVRAIEDAMLAEYFRRLHPERARKYIREKLAAQLKFRDVPLVGDVADICESHAWGVRESNDPRDPNKAVARLAKNRRISSFRVNLQYLACCLRLGDILDFDRSRTPLSVYEEINFTEEESIKEWNKHLSINGWDINEHRVLFDAACTHPAYYVAVHDFLNWVDAELRECHYLLDDVPAGDSEKYALHLAHAVDRRQVRMSDTKYLAGGFRFRLEYEEIMRLLMDKSLYPDSTLFLRELLQNALDACRYQEALAKEAGMEDKYKPRIMVWDHSEDKDAPRIVFQDNGIGMSQRQVEGFFLRVGKSFYRSPEFDAERQRLAARGIHLDACSQFGIGFLSCFLGGDLIEVETWRYGNAPLKITITGPSKYFLIERLSQPDNAIPFKSPDNELEDGPPKFTGTRVTVHLKDSWHTYAVESEHGVVHQTLDAFAVNQEYDLRVFQFQNDQPIVIKRRRWEAEGPLFPELSNSQNFQLAPYLLPSVFDLNNYSDELRGQGAIWMLKGPDGKPSPTCGDLSVGLDYTWNSDFNVGIPAPDLSLLSDIRKFIEHDKNKDTKTIIDFFSASNLKTNPYVEVEFLREAANFFAPDEQRLNNYSNKSMRIIKFLADDFSALTSAQRIWLVNILRSKVHLHHVNWFENIEIIKALAGGDRDALLHNIQKQGLPNFSATFTLHRAYMFSLFGINVPAGLLDWDPLKGQAKTEYFLPSSVGVRIDAYGQLAPRPVGCLCRSKNPNYYVLLSVRPS